MLSSKNNDFYNFLYKKGTENNKPDNYLFKKYGDRQKYGVILWDSYFKNVNDIKTYFPNLNIYNFEFDVCYPYLYNDMDNILSNNAPLSDKFIALHWYGGHPITRHWENLLTPDNYKQHNTTLCNCIKRGLNEN